MEEDDNFDEVDEVDEVDDNIAKDNNKITAS